LALFLQATLILECDNEDSFWSSFLEINLGEISQYQKYVSNQSRYDTHQGVKGLEFPRVIVSIDDDSKGPSFNYEKLFGTKPLSDTDIKNINEGKDSTIDRTKRLLYVACSRAEKSLAVAIYSDQGTEIKNTVLANDWFQEKEIILLR
jgi:DNA helicase-2/ATP-dependent DNA helicase PcrA